MDAISAVLTIYVHTLRPVSVLVVTPRWIGLFSLSGILMDFRLFLSDRSTATRIFVYIVLH
jgi:hypothetical protein